MRFDHIGVPTSDRKDHEMFVAETKVHVTDPDAHPYRIEFLRFEPDSPVTGPVRDQQHVAFRMDDLEEAIGGEDVLLGPFHATETLRVAFALKDGVVFEFMDLQEEEDWVAADLE